MEAENFVEIVPLALSQGVSMKSAYILLLRQKIGTRCLPLLISEEEQEWLARAMRDGEYPTIDPMMEVVYVCQASLKCVLLTMNRQGVFKAIAMFRVGGRMRFVEYAPVTGVLIAMRAGCRIMVPRQIFDSQFMADAGDGQVALPLPMMSEELLNEALQAAVKSEHFELAQVLSQELKRRSASADEKAGAAVKSEEP